MQRNGRSNNNGGGGGGDGRLVVLIGVVVQGAGLLRRRVRWRGTVRMS